MGSIAPGWGMHYGRVTTRLTWDVCPSKKDLCGATVGAGDTVGDGVTVGEGVSVGEAVVVG